MSNLATLARALLLLTMLMASIHPSSPHDWRSHRDRLLGITRRSKSSKSGWKRVKKIGFVRLDEDQEWEWERIDLPEDAALRIGVKYCPSHCPRRSKSGDFLSVHYNGTLYSNNDLFDSSILREEPFIFQIGRKQMNLGWEKGLLDMCVGEKRQLVVPSGKAYGQTKAHGSEGGTRVMPGATVVYHVELLDILSEEEAAAHLVWGL